MRLSLELAYRDYNAEQGTEREYLVNFPRKIRDSMSLLSMNFANYKPYYSIGDNDDDNDDTWWFEEVPTNQSIVLGENLLLKCAAKSTASNEILYSQWKNNRGELLGFDDAGVIDGFNQHYSYISKNPHQKYLFIQNISIEDDGVFECQMSRHYDRGYRASAYIDIIVPPTRIELLSDNLANGIVSIEENNLLNISCAVYNAKPSGQLAWLSTDNHVKIDNYVNTWEIVNKNRTVITYSTLLWKAVRTDNDKSFACVSYHSYKSTKLSVNFTLSVLYAPEKPKIEVISEGDILKEGYNVTLSCKTIGGNPRPTVNWFLNKQIISDKHYYDENTKETINKYSMIVEAGDNGITYECQTWNYNNNVMNEIVQLNVTYPPDGVDFSAENSVKLGNILSVQCRSHKSNPPSKTIWFVNGVSMEPENETVYEEANSYVTSSILSVNTSDIIINRYKISLECIARNTEGSSKKHHEISILASPGKPIIYGDSDNIREGDLLNLTCESHGGNPLAHLSWYRNVHKIKEIRSAVYGDISQSIISILLDRTMNNKYVKCEANNAALDRPLFVNRMIHVLFPPRNLAIHYGTESEHEIISGKPTKLVCVSSSSNPSPSIGWEFENDFKDFRVEALQNKSNQEFGGFHVEMSIEFIANKEMNGIDLKCIASHPLWNMPKVKAFPINVFYPPSTRTEGQITIAISEGDSFKENITVDANPIVTSWRWKKNGVNFSGNIGSIITSGATITGRYVRSFDSGTYSLIAANSVGLLNVTINLIVEYAAYVKHVTSPLIAALGEEVIMECIVDGVPKKDGMVKWLYNDAEVMNVLLVGKVRAVLKLNASHETDGKYVCVADNGLAEPNRTEAYLLVKKAPMIDREATLAKAAGPIGGRARLSCLAEAVPDAIFHWIIDGRVSPLRFNDSKYSFHTKQIHHSLFESILWINGLDQYDYQRKVKCVVMNRLGVDSIEIRVGPLTKPDAPSKIRVVNVTRSSLTVDWLPGFDGGADQIFELKYQQPNENVYHTINTSTPNLEIKDLKPATRYEFWVRAYNTRGFWSDYTYPSMYAYTKDHNDLNILDDDLNDSFPRYILILFAIGGVFLLILNCLLLCFLDQRKKKKNMMEKTEMVRRSNGDSDVRPIQMYGAVANAEHSYRPESATTNRSEIGREAISEDDESLRTIIEVSSNGYVQQVDPSIFYDKSFNMDHEFEPNYYANMIRAETLRKRSSNTLPGHDSLGMPITPTTARKYAEMDSVSRLYDVGSLSSHSPRIRVPRIIDIGYGSGNLCSTSNNNNSLTPQMLRTFVRPNGVQTTPLSYSRIDGDLV